MVLSHCIFCLDILVQEEPQPPQIKEEQDELLLRPEEGVTLLAVKSEDESREAEPVTITSAEHMNTQAEDCRTPQPTTDDQLLSSHLSESDTEDSDECEETKEYNLALNTVTSHTTHISY